MELYAFQTQLSVSDSYFSGYQTGIFKIYLFHRPTSCRFHVGLLSLQWEFLYEMDRICLLTSSIGFCFFFRRDIVSGVAHLHELSFIHRDLKPQNVLIIKDKVFCAKLSDMGISKRLIGDMSSLTQHATGMCFAFSFHMWSLLEWAN